MLSWRKMDILSTFKHLVCDLEVTINGKLFNCHCFPFYAKSLYLKDIISRASNVTDLPITIDLSELPGGESSFEQVRSFCYAGSLTLTPANALVTLSAAKFLRFVEVSFCEICKTFIETDIMTNMHAIISALSSMAAGVSKDVWSYYEPKLIARIGPLGLRLQEMNSGRVDEVFRLLSGLNQLRPETISKILKEFRKNGAELVDAICSTKELADWYTGPTSGSARLIVGFLTTDIARGIHCRTIQVDQVHPTILVHLLLDLSAKLAHGKIKEYLGANISFLRAENVIHVSPKAVQLLVSTARDANSTEEHLMLVAEFVDDYLKLGSEVRLDTLEVETFKELVRVTEIARPSHDTLYDAVSSFVRSNSRHEAPTLWDLIDVKKLSDSKMGQAENSSLPNHTGFLVSLVRSQRDMIKSLKRDVACLHEENASQRRRQFVMSEFSIFIKSPQSRTCTVTVSRESTIRTVKLLVKGKVGMQISKSWRLYYRVQELHDDLTVAAYGITKDCTLLAKCFMARVGGSMI